MGSGSEVSKQAARMILTDDNFGTLVPRRRARPHHLRQGRLVHPLPDVPALALVLVFLAATPSTSTAAWP
jgi:Ca2+-transporting ATPase